jgi:hypothetical protein
MDWWVAALVFAIYLLVQGLVMARCTAEGGLLITEGCFTPMDVLTMEKYSLLSPRNLTAMALKDAVLFRDLRGIPITGFLDAQKLSDETRLAKRTLLGTLVVGILAAIAVAFVFQLWLPYTYGRAEPIRVCVRAAADAVFPRERAVYDPIRRRDARACVPPALFRAGVRDHAAAGVGSVGVPGLSVPPVGLRDECDLGRDCAVVFDAGSRG